MSKDMLGPVVRAAVGVPQERFDLLAKIASRFSIKSPESRPDGEVWHAYFQKLIDGGLPDAAFLIGVQPTEVVLGEYTVDYDMTVAQKLEGEKARHLTRAGNFLSDLRHLSVGMIRPRERTGTMRYKASAVGFDKALTRSVVIEWCRQNNKITADLKEGLDIIVATPLLTLAHAMPLLMLNECRYDHQEFFYVPRVNEEDGKVFLGFARFECGKNETLWSKQWKFLVLEELPPLS